MKVTDWDIKSETFNIRLEINDREWIDLPTKTFIEHIADRNEWFYDPAKLALVIPEEKLVWHDELNSFTVDSIEVKVITWDEMKLEYRHKLQNWFQGWADNNLNSEDYDQEPEFDEYQEIKDAILHRQRYS